MPGLCGETQRTAHRIGRADRCLPDCEGELALYRSAQHGGNSVLLLWWVDDSCSLSKTDYRQKLTPRDNDEMERSGSG
jgi:hypothetical protein